MGLNYKQCIKKNFIMSYIYIVGHVIVTSQVTQRSRYSPGAEQGEYRGQVVISNGTEKTEQNKRKIIATNEYTKQ